MRSLPACAQLDYIYQEQSARDFLAFVRGLWIPTSDGPQLFGGSSGCINDFQEETFAALVPSLHALRQGEKCDRRRWWIERTKGAGKDSDLAAVLLWLLAFPVRPIYLQVGAADRDQAAIIRRRMFDLLHYNPWLTRLVSVQAYRAVNQVNRLAELDVLAADIAGSQGDAPDLLIVNELTQVRKWEFIENLLDNADKVARGMVIIATNAGFRGTKAEKLRQNAEKNTAKWTMLLWQKPAPWISSEDVADAKRRDLPSRYNRLWWGRWASGKGDALQEDDIEACLTACEGPLDKPEGPGWTYIAGLDLGVSHDHSALVVVGINPRAQRIRIASVQAWQPQEKTRSVDLQAVERAVYDAFLRFHLHWIGYDPTEARLMAQQLRGRNVPMFEVSFGSSVKLNDMANALVQTISGRILDGYEDHEGRLRRDFGKLSLVERPWGYKLEAVSDENGHADVGVALAIALPRAVSMLSSVGRLQADDQLLGGESDYAELNDDELSAMPKELRDIYASFAPPETDDDAPDD